MQLVLLSNLNHSTRMTQQRILAASGVGHLCLHGVSLGPTEGDRVGEKGVEGGWDGIVKCDTLSQITNAPPATSPSPLGCGISYDNDNEPLSLSANCGLRIIDHYHHRRCRYPRISKRYFGYQQTIRTSIKSTNISYSRPSGDTYEADKTLFYL